LSMPHVEQRIAILKNELYEFISSEEEFVYRPLAELLDGSSSADVCKFANNVKRRNIIYKENIMDSCLHELELHTKDKKIRGKFTVLVKQIFAGKITVRKIAELTGLSPAGVQHHINKSKEHARETS
jgi:hypothetical protein